MENSSAVDTFNQEAVKVQMTRKLQREAFKRGNIIAPTIESFHLSMSNMKHLHWARDDIPGGLWDDAAGQVDLIMQQVQMPNLRHLHVTWDYDLVTESTGGYTLQRLADIVGSLVLSNPKSIKFCIHMHVGLAHNLPTPVEDLLQDMAIAFDKPQWHDTEIVVNLMTKDGLYGSEFDYFPSEHSIERLASSSLNSVRAQLPDADEMSEGIAETPQEISLELKLTLNIYARSAFFEGYVPIARLHHSTETHQEGVDDPELWRSHFEYTEFEPDQVALAESARRALRWDVNDAIDSDFMPDSDDLSFDSDSGSAISDSFRRSPTPL